MDGCLQGMRVEYVKGDESLLGTSLLARADFGEAGDLIRQA